MLCDTNISLTLHNSYIGFFFSVSLLLVVALKFFVQKKEKKRSQNLIR